MSAPPIPYKAFEEHAEKLVLQMREEYRIKNRCSEVYSERMSDLLKGVAKVDWAKRPRTYIVLRMIGRVDAMDSFVEQDLRDIHFPYTQKRLPGSLTDMSDRLRFVDAQSLVLTPAKYIEDIGDGRHVHFREVVDNLFETIKPLGRGGFGYVDHVRSNLSLNELALKRSLRHTMFSRDKALLATFETELSILKRLSHEHLVKYVGSYTDPKWVVILMTPVADGDLRHFLDRKDVSQFHILIRHFYGCLATAVQYLHVNRIRHKDLKPQNILVKGTKVLITDFGTALDWTDRSRATTTGNPGPYSAAYAAPEVADRENRSESSDIWSLGCVFLEMTTVLKNSTNQERTSFFTSKSNGNSNFWANPDAFVAWLRILERTPQDNITISWIRSMTHQSRTKRIAISSLVDEILNYQDDHVYYGPCCASRDDGDSSSYVGSPTHEPSDVTNTDDLHSYPPPKRQSLLGQDSNGEVIPHIHGSYPHESIEATAGTNTVSDFDISDLSSTRTTVTPEPIELEDFGPSAMASNTVSSHGGAFDPNPPLPPAVKDVDRLLGRSNTGLDAGKAMPAMISDRVDALLQHAYVMHEHDTNVRERLRGLVATSSYSANYAQADVQNPLPSLAFSSENEGPREDAYNYSPAEPPASWSDLQNATSATTTIMNPYADPSLSQGSYTAVQSQPSEEVGVSRNTYYGQQQPTYKPRWNDILEYTGISSFKI